MGDIIKRGIVFALLGIFMLSLAIARADTPDHSKLQITLTNPHGIHGSLTEIPLEFSMVSFSLEQEYTCHYVLTYLSDGLSGTETSHDIPDCNAQNSLTFDVTKEGNYELEVFVSAKDGSEGSESTSFSVDVPEPPVNDDSSDDSGSSSSRRSGGGGSCITDWICSEWSACNDGFQIRSCFKDQEYCYAGERPELVRECEEPITLGAETDLVVEDQNFVSRLTGAVVGSGGRPTALGVVIFLVFVTAAYFVVSTMKPNYLEESGKKGSKKAAKKE